MKTINKIVLASLGLLLLPNSVTASICPESEHHKRWSNLSVSEQKKYREPDYCEVVLQTAKGEPTLKYENFPSKYSLIDNGLVTSVKNQGSTGTCWAFASAAVIESVALKNNLGSYTISPRFLEYSTAANAYINGINKYAMNRQLDAGGEEIIAASSLFIHGAISNDDVPFINNAKPTLKENIEGSKPVLSIGEYRQIRNGRTIGCSSDDINRIKSLLINNGAVGANILFDGNLVDQYNITTDDTNHSVTIVGWDDNYVINSTTKGAWLVKNSHGSTWGRNGYFYVAYRDNTICSYNFQYNNISKKTFDVTYYESNVVSQGYIPVSFANKSYLSSKYTITEDSLVLKRVAVPMKENQVANVYLSTSLNGSRRLLGTVKGNDDLVVKSIDINDIVLTKGDYYLTVEYNTDYNSIYIPVNCKSFSRSSTLEYNSNQSFLSTDGTNWMDLSDEYKCKGSTYMYFDRPAIQSIYVNNIYVTILSNIKELDTNTYTFKVFNSSNVDVTDKFIVDGSLRNNNLRLNGTSKLPSGNYYFMLYTNNVPKSYKFTINNPDYAGVYITFNANGGSGSMDVLATLDNNITLPNPKFIAPFGKKFKGWSLTSNGPVVSNINISEDTTVYAIWEIIPITGITLSKTNFTGRYGLTYKLTATISPANTGQSKVVTWTSSDPTVATIDKNGYIKILKTSGYTYITAKTSNGILSRIKITATKANASDIAVKAIPTQTYSGSYKKPKLTVTYNGKKLVLNKDYTITYKNNKYPGKASATIKIKSNSKYYTGSKTVYFYILPKKVTQYTPSTKRKSVTVKWAKQSKISGYEVYFKKSTDTTWRYFNVATKYTALKITDLQKGKKYNFKVRSYKIIDGKKYYGSFSTTKSITCK